MRQIKDKATPFSLTDPERRRIQAFLAKGPGYRFAAIRWLRKRRGAAEGMSFPLGLAIQLVDALGVPPNRCE